MIIGGRITLTRPQEGDDHDGGAVDVTRGADAVALAFSGAVHGAILAVAFVVAWPGQSPPAVMPVELVEPTPDSAISPRARIVEPRPQPARLAARPAPPVPAPPARPEPSTETPALPAPSPPATAPETPAPETRAEAPVVAPATPSPPPATTPWARGDAPGATAVMAVEPTGEVPPAMRAEPERAAPPAVIAAVPPGAPAERVTQAARPRGGYQVRPPYPAAARQARAEGTTMLRVHVAADGSIADVQVQRSAGHAALDEAAAAAVRRWRFEPARTGSTAVAVWVVIPVEFRLKSDF
jgi:protein TonB